MPPKRPFLDHLDSFFSEDGDCEVCSHAAGCDVGASTDCAGDSQGQGGGQRGMGTGGLAGKIVLKHCPEMIIIWFEISRFIQRPFSLSDSFLTF